MSIYRNERVDMPANGFYLKENHGTIYVYQYTQYYRNSSGQPRNKSCIIGVLDSDENRLIPNDNYYKLNNSMPSLSYDSVMRYGYTFLCDHITETTGLKHILSQVFGEQVNEILAMAYYMIHEGTVMNYCEDWLEDVYVSGLSNLIASQSSSSTFKSISFEKRQRFFELWVKRAVDNEYICYDVTSISSYSSGLIEAEPGYNRDGEKLAQVNLGMFCGEKTKLPVYYNIYNGSLTDKTNLLSVIENAKDVGLEKIKVVMDGGFCDQKRLEGLQATGLYFTVGVPSYLIEAQKYIKDYGTGINKASNKLRSHPEYVKRIDTEFMGVRGNILLCFNETLHSDLTSALLVKVEKLENKLKGLKRYPTKGLKQFQQYFELEKKDDGFTYQMKHDIIDEEAEKAGFFLLFTTDTKSDTEDLLYFYRAKDIDEKLFYQLKVYIEGNRLRIHNEKTMEGKIFVIFIALIIRSYMAEKLKSYLHTEHITLKKAILRLSDIKIIKSRGACRYVKALTKKQKDLLNLFCILEKINESLNKLKI